MKKLELWSNRLIHVNLFENIKEIDFGWLSETSLPTEDRDLCECVGYETLKQIREELILPHMLELYDIEYHDYKLRSWIINNNSGLIEALHEHKNAHISSVFYPVADGGKIVFSDPRGNVGVGQPKELRKLFSEVEFVPKSGDLIVFPSYLEHYSFGVNGQRICMPTDLRYTYGED